MQITYYISKLYFEHGNEFEIRTDVIMVFLNRKKQYADKYYNYQNALLNVFCSVVLLFSRGNNNLNEKGKSQSILLIVAKRRHHANVLLVCCCDVTYLCEEPLDCICKKYLSNVKINY